MRKTLMRWAICLAPSGVILAVIGVGGAMQLAWFQLSWENDLLFALVVLAVLLPLSKLPLLLLGKAEEEDILTIFPDFPATERERAAHIQMLQARLARLKDS